MLQRLYCILKYWLAWILIFQLSRLAFVIFQGNEIQSLQDKLSLMWYGLRMDISMATYLSLPVLLMVIITIFFNRPAIIKIARVYNYFILFFIFLIIIADAFIFMAWGFRLDASVFRYMKNPKEAWASVYNQPLLLIFIFFAGIIIMVAFLFNKLVFNNLRFHKVRRPFLIFLVFLIIGGAMIIPLRGGLQLAPINQSSVYFSSNNFLNQAALNAPWNFLFSLNKQSKFSHNPYNYFENGKAQALKDSLYKKQTAHSPLIKLKPGIKPNIIFIVWESLTAKVLGRKAGDIYITPGMNQLINEGVYFSNIYASGDRTDKGIVALLSGFPAQPVTSIVKEPLKSSKLPSLSKELIKLNYKTSFYYGGELEFANIKSYLFNSGFYNLTSIHDFEKKDLNSKWGAHDGVVMQKLFRDIDGQKAPFFYTWMTLSSHEPFETPVPAVIEGSDDQSLFFNSLHYTDSIIYRFIKQCEAKDWWQNTLVVICADHGHRMPQTGQKIDDFKIPALILGGALQNKKLIVDKVCSQTDIAATILSLLHVNNNSFTWGTNIADTSAAHAFFCFNDGFGFVQKGRYFIFDNVGKIIMEQKGKITSSDIEAGKALQQLSFQEYIDK